MQSKRLMIILIAVIITGCRFQCSIGNDSTPKEVFVDQSNGPMKGAIIRNDIELDAKDVKVKEAYLLNEDRQILEQNEIPLGKKIRCTVILDTGWTKYNGRSFIGASEKVLTEDGTVVLDEPDLLKESSASSFSAEDAKVLSVTAFVTTKAPGVDVYKVQFRLWDKRGTGEVTGRFKFKVK